jgi:hypothetical protein
MVPRVAGCNVAAVHNKKTIAMFQLLLVWARPLLALSRFYIHRAEVKRRFMRLQQHHLTDPAAR